MYVHTPRIQIFVCDLLTYTICLVGSLKSVSYVLTKNGQKRVRFIMPCVSLNWDVDYSMDISSCNAIFVLLSSFVDYSVMSG